MSRAWWARRRRSFRLPLRLSPLTVVVVSLIAVAPGARGAALMVALSSPDDLSHLTIGQVARIDVSLSGLESGEQLVTLTGGVSYTPALLGPPAGVAAGPIVPNPLDALTDFQTTTTASEADAAFLTSSTLPAKDITSNGVFYSFQITGASLGAGTLQVDPLALVAEQFDPLNPASPILRSVDAGPALSFTVVVPEPGAVVPMGFAAAALWLHRRRGRSHIERCPLRQSQDGT